MKTGVLLILSLICIFLAGFLTGLSLHNTLVRFYQ